VASRNSNNKSDSRLNENLVFAGVAVAIAVTIAFMLALRPVVIDIGLVDRPGGRKAHPRDEPILGGIAMFAGMFSGFILIPGIVLSMPSLFVASFLILVIGILDDRFHIPAAVRLTAQMAAVLIMVYGLQLNVAGIGNPFGTGEIFMGRFTLILTMLVTLTMINAYNLIDGVDGLAGSLALVAFLCVAVVAGVGHVVTAAALTISAAIAGFLTFNLPFVWNRKLRAFMGDAGSTLLGFTIVWVTLEICQGPERLISPVHCLWFASIPIYDTLTCFVRRSLAGKSPLAPGRDHFHHTLKRGGYKVREVLGILTGLQAIYAISALIGHFTNVPDVVMFTTWSVLGLSQRSIIHMIATRHRAALMRRRSQHPI